MTDICTDAHLAHYIKLLFLEVSNGYFQLGWLSVSQVSKLGNVLNRFCGCAQNNITPNADHKIANGALYSAAHKIPEVVLCRMPSSGMWRRVYLV
jgi:hypothetical protein